MFTFEDVTALFLKTAAEVGLTTHPEYWANARSLEREFACVCHTGGCENAENRSTCTLSFSWSSLDTALSLEGPRGVCEFFHDANDDCPHLHTRDIPPLVLDLSYSLLLHGEILTEADMLSLTQQLKLRASEHSSQTVETRPGISLILQDNRLRPEAITLQQRVELPIWHPEGMRGLHDDRYREDQEDLAYNGSIDKEREELESGVRVDTPHPEEWLPSVLNEVCQDILQVLEALDATRSHGALNLDM